MFIAKTHEAYYERLEPYFGHTIQAMFTDEPSLIAINIGQIPDDARKRVRVVDPLGPGRQDASPGAVVLTIFSEQYQERYGEDLAPHRRSLFVGDAPEDRKVRRQFWELVAELIAERYFGAIQDWCSKHQVASSGHTLHEESIMHHVAAGGKQPEGVGSHGHSRTGHALVGPRGGDPQRLADGRRCPARPPCSAAAAG